MDNTEELRIRETVLRMSDLERRLAIEDLIRRKLVQSMLAQGFLITVNDGEEDVVMECGDFETIVVAMDSTDEDQLYFWRNGLNAGFVRLIYGNDGWDVINDHSTRLDAELKETNDYAASFEPK
jgi:hypothetical protein